MYEQQKIPSPLIPSILTLLALAAPAGAGPMFQVSVDTNAIQGTSGSFDVQFNPGGIGALAATATISNFLTDGTALSLNTTDGDVSGTLLPGPLNISNTQAFNDLLENITFGKSISFTLTLSGPGVTSPDPSMPGSSFALTLYDGAFNPLLTTDPAGTLVTTNLDPDGSTAVLTFPSDISGGPPSGNAVPLPSATPEPSSILLLGTALAGMGAQRLVKRRRVNSRDFLHNKITS